MKSKILLTTIIILASCTGSKNKVNVDVDVNVNTEEITNAEATDTEKQADKKYKDVLTRVKHIYSVVLSNTQYKDNFLSKEVNAIFEEGDKLSNGDIWGPDCNFWLYAQDFGNNAHLIEATINEVKNDTTVILECHIDIDLGTNESERFDTLYITMIKEDGEWYGDDSSNDKKWSYKKCCLDDIKHMKEQAKKQE